MRSRTPTLLPCGQHQLRWALNERMQAKGIRSLTELHRRLQLVLPDAISFCQLTRLSTTMPEKLNLKTLAGLCVVLECNTEDLLSIHPASPLEHTS